jgi:DNA-binding transcriptional LysR family regulator
MLREKDYIYEVYREKSFTKAAKKLFVTQPALSASVKKAELELGAEIFDRRSSEIRLTEAGRAVIDAIEKINAAEEELQNRLSEINELKTGTISVGAPNSVFTCVLPQILTAFRAAYPGIELRFLEASSAELKEAAASGLIDVCLDYDFDERLFRSTPLKSETIYLCAGTGTAFAAEHADLALSVDDISGKKKTGVPAIDLSVCRGSDLILLKKGNDMCSRAEAMLGEAGVSEFSAMRLDQLMTAYSLACRGLGITFVTDTVICSVRREAAYFRLSSPRSKRLLCLGQRRNALITGRVTGFIATAAGINSGLL